MPPRLLFSSAALFARPLAETVAVVADAGFTGIEVMVTKDPASQDAHRMRELADARGLVIGAIHAPALLLTRSVWGTDPVGKIYRSIEVAEEAEIPIVVTHPPYRWQRGYRRWLNDRLPGLEVRTGVTVAIENMFPVGLRGVGVHMHANADLEQLVGLPELTLDTSHAAVAGHDPIDVRRAFGDRLRHVHLSDNAGKGWDSHLPPGEGVLDLDGFLDDLTASGYGGAITLEVDLRQHLGDLDALVGAMRTMRERVEARLASSGPTDESSASGSAASPC
jgi:sugar phosphate isomerase/epimerase